MTNGEILNAILNANVTKEQRDALLGEYANKLIRENKEKAKTWEEKNEETKEKSRKQSEEVKERLKEYEERSLKEEKQRIFDKEVEEKIKELEQIENKNGEKIYSNLRDSSAYEILALYDSYYNNPSLSEEKTIANNEPDTLQYASEELKNDKNDKEIVNEAIKENPKTEKKPLTEEQKKLIENVKKVEENIGKKLKVVDFEENMKKFPKSFSEFVSKGGLKPDWIGRRIVKSIKNKFVEWKNKKAEVSEKQLLAKDPSLEETVEMPKVQIPEEQLLKEEKIDKNSAIIANSIVPEEQLLGIENDPTLKALEAMPVGPVYEENPIPELTETEEMNLDQLYNPVNKQTEQVKSL